MKSSKDNSSLHAKLFSPYLKPSKYHYTRPRRKIQFWKAWNILRGHHLLFASGWNQEYLWWNHGNRWVPFVLSCFHRIWNPLNTITPDHAEKISAEKPEIFCVAFTTLCKTFKSRKFLMKSSKDSSSLHAKLFSPSLKPSKYHYTRPRRKISAEKP